MDQSGRCGQCFLLEEKFLCSCTHLTPVILACPGGPLGGLSHSAGPSQPHVPDHGLPLCWRGCAVTAGGEHTRRSTPCFPGREGPPPRGAQSRQPDLLLGHQESPGVTGGRATALPRASGPVPFEDLRGPGAVLRVVSHAPGTFVSGLWLSSGVRRLCFLEPF